MVDDLYLSYIIKEHRYQHYYYIFACVTKDYSLLDTNQKFPYRRYNASILQGKKRDSLMVYLHYEIPDEDAARVDYPALKSRANNQIVLEKTYQSFKNLPKSSFNTLLKRTEAVTLLAIYNTVEGEQRTQSENGGKFILRSQTVPAPSGCSQSSAPNSHVT